ncbi:MAG: enoyl-CoA hydratase-related protein [Actinomycetota bacterium]|nr:enoyl-CoA hydratase-related protein [Actinomycetota bacterium]
MTSESAHSTEDGDPGEAVRYTSESGVATLTMAQVATRNALTEELLVGLLAGLERASSDPSVRVVVLSHDGPVFCAGADLRQGRAPVGPGADGLPGSKPGSQPGRADLPAVLSAIQDLPLPVVARIAGPCLGGGLGLAAACDLSVAGEDVLLGFSEVRLGVAPAIISVVCLPKLRRGDALQLMLTGERISASRAAQLGLISRAVPTEQLDDAVAQVVDQLKAGGPRALAATKALVLGSDRAARDAALSEMSALSAALFAGEESAEGRAAFQQRRPPSWVRPPT